MVGIHSAPKDVQELLANWIEFSGRLAEAHRVEALGLKRKHTWTGGTSAFLTAVVGTGIFASIPSEPVSDWLKVTCGLVSVGAAGLAGLVVFSNPAELAGKHAAASEEYLGIRRRLEMSSLSVVKMTVPQWRRALDGVSHELEEVGKRVSIPKGLKRVETVVRRSRGLFPGGSGASVESILGSTVMRSGFVDELETLAALADAQED
jgi:hypothetical protein